MIQLTNQTKINKLGEEIDDSLFLIHFDSRNLAIVRGQRGANGRYNNSQIQGYYGSIKSALTRSIDLAIKSGTQATELYEMLQRIDDLARHIEELPDYPTMMSLLRGNKDED